MPREYRKELTRKLPLLTCKNCGGNLFLDACQVNVNGVGVLPKPYIFKCLGCGTVQGLPEMRPPAEAKP